MDDIVMREVIAVVPFEFGFETESFRIVGEHLVAHVEAVNALSISHS